MTKPKAFEESDFETLLSSYISHAISYCAGKDAEKAKSLKEALNNDSELLAQMIQSFVVKRQAEIREQNYQALQMFRKYVTESDMIDLIAMRYNLTRQTLQAADNSVFPPKPAVMESDEDLLRRYDLAPYQFHTTGTRLGYKFHALTLDERPMVTIESEPDSVIMKYQFPEEIQPNPVKDAEARMLQPNTGKVAVTVLSRETKNGIPSNELLERVRQYLTRDDIAQETDEISTKAAEIINYKIHVVLYTGGDPSNHVNQADAESTAWAFAEKMHRLNNIIDREEVGHIFYELGAHRAKVIEPSADVVCKWNQAPFCTEVVIDVRSE